MVKKLETILKRDLKPAVMLDRLQRPLTDLRISVTDRCNLRCTYCMPVKPDGELYQFLPKNELLTFEEIALVVKALAQTGLQKIRLTGGEPLLRKDLEVLIAKLKDIDGIKEIALTTNGLFLKEKISTLVDAGLDRITLSLDAIDQQLLNQISGRPVDLDKIYAGIDAVLALNVKLKINTVIQKNINDEHFIKLLERFRGTPIEVRLIEFMDVGNANQWKLDKVVPSKELINRIEQHWPLEAMGRQQINDVADRYRYKDGQGSIGFISSITQPFCGNCSRARLSSEGKLFTCLFANKGFMLREHLRKGMSGQELQDLLQGHWHKRDDRYSELRSSLAVQSSSDSNEKSDRIEMFYIGG